MKLALSYDMVNMTSSLSGGMNLNYKWYWEDVIDWTAATGFDSIALSMIPNAFNVGRSGAPRCTLAINTKYGSAQGYLNFLNDHGIESVCAMNVSAQAMLADMFESGKRFEDLYPEMFSYAEDVTDMLAALGGKVLNVSPTPAIGALKARFGDDAGAFSRFASEAVACVNRIGEMSARKGVRTSLNNEFWTLARGNEVDKCFKDLDRSVVGYTASTAMLQVAGVDPVAAVKKNMDRLDCVIFTDTEFVDTVNCYASAAPEYPQSGPQQRVYKDLGYGKVDLKGVYRTLKESGYDGLVLLEPRYTTNVPRAMLRTRTFWTKLTKED